MQVNQFPDQAAFVKLAENHNVIPVVREILADTETPVSLMQKVYQHKGPLFLLESVEGGERWGRYSFLGISARSQIRVFRNMVEIKEDGQSRSVPHNGDPLGILREYMQVFRPAAVAGLPRFWGGMVGYFTYEIKTERFDPSSQSWDDIYGRAPFTVGLTEITLHPGIYLKTGLNFEFGTQSTKIKALEVGGAIDIAPTGLSIMSNNTNQIFFPTFYLTFSFGKRFNKY